jgi:hypothetical protein
MTPIEKKRFLFINFSMLGINSASDEIYEALADNDIDEAVKAIDAMMQLASDLKEAIAGGDNPN